MLHYTLNTNDTTTCSTEFDDWFVKFLEPKAQQIVNLLSNPDPDSPTTLRFDLAGEFAQYNVKATPGPGCCMFDLNNGIAPMTVNSVVWTREAQGMVWPMVESQYLKLSAQIGTFRGSSSPRMPNSLPWLSTFVLPLLTPDAAPWVASFEQCLAMLIVQRAKPARKRPKGFG